MSEPIAAALDDHIDVSVQLDTWGEVTALAAFARGDGEHVAFGGEGRVCLAPITAEGISGAHWEADVGFRAAALLWDGAVLWAAGSERSPEAIDDYDWESRRGGGFAGIDPIDGRVVVRGQFPDEVAWGNGGVAVVMIPGALCAIGRTGRVHAFDVRDGSRMSVSEPIADHSLGIAHAAAIGDRIVYGFNRGGYQLYGSRARRLMTRTA